MHHSPRPSPSSSASKILLATGEVATVEACACGTVHLHLGTVTIRLTHTALESLRCTLEDAVLASALARMAPTDLRRH